jgi:hypothetical protein
MTYGISCSTLPDNVKLYLKPVSFSAHLMKHMLIDLDGRYVDGAGFIENTVTYVQKRKQNRSRKIGP